MVTMKKALVTGSSSGIGAAFAAHLARQGSDLVLVARRQDRLETLAERLRGETGVSVEVLKADLADPTDLHRIEERIEQGDDIDLLVNNAGIGDIAHFVDQERDTHQRMIAVNVLALTRLSHAAIPGMVERGGGTIINVASGFAFDYMPGASVYAATKSYVAQLTHVLDAELREKGMRFQALVPGLTRTELGGDAEFFDMFPPEHVMSPEVLVEVSLASLGLGERVCIPRLADIGEWERAHAAIRAVGKSPPHNQVAPRYGLNQQSAG